MGSICFFIGILLPHWDKYGDPWGIDIAFVAAAFVMAGKLLRPLFDRLENLCFGCFVTAAIGLILLLIGVHFNITSVGYVLMANAIYGNILQFVVGAMGGSILLLSVSVLVSKCQFMGKKWIRYIGKNTLGIFLVHKPIVALGRKVVMQVGLDYNHFALCILISLVSLLISLAVVYMIDHLLPEVLGRRKA